MSIYKEKGLYKMFNLKNEIESLLEYRELTKAELARFLNISPQHLNSQLNSKNLNLQFLKNVADITDCNLQIFFQDNKYKQKIDTKEKILLEQIKKLSKNDFTLVSEIVTRLNKNSQNINNLLQNEEINS